MLSAVKIDYFSFTHFNNNNNNKRSLPLLQMHWDGKLVDFDKYLEGTDKTEIHPGRLYFKAQILQIDQS